MLAPEASKEQGQVSFFPLRESSLPLQQRDEIDFDMVCNPIAFSLGLRAKRVSG